MLYLRKWHGVENERRFLGEDGMIHDDYRIEFVSEHLKYVHQAIQEGQIA